MSPRCFTLAFAIVVTATAKAETWHVGFQRGTSDYGAVAASVQGLQVVRCIPQIGAVVVRGPRRGLDSLPNVRYVEPEGRARALFAPDDPLIPQQWGLGKMQCPLAWNRSRGSATVVIAVIDTGIDVNHPDLSGKLVPGWDFVNDDADGDDDNGHGTAVAGVAAAATDNGTGIAGVGFDCRLMPVKVLNSGGSGSLTDVAAGIVFAADHGAQVVNISAGTGSPSQLLEDAVDHAWAKGCVVTAAAGGSGGTAPTYPAYYGHCIAVASSDQGDRRASFSTYGPWVDVAAPGVDIVTTYQGGGYSSLSGTSFSTGEVSGLAALVWSLFGPGSGNTFVRGRVEEGCDPVGPYVAHGRVNARRSLQFPLAIGP